jgi:hypothetical protein
LWLINAELYSSRSGGLEESWGFGVVSVFLGGQSLGVLGFCGRLFLEFDTKKKILRVGDTCGLGIVGIAFVSRVSCSFLGGCEDWVVGNVGFVDGRCQVVHCADN